MTDPSPQSKTEATLRALRVRFRADSWSTVDVFRRLAAELGADPAMPGALERLEREAHRLHGTAGSFGFHRASALAASIEERAIAWRADPALDHADRASAVAAFVVALERSFAEEV